MEQSMMLDPLFKIGAITALVESSVLIVASVLYWGAYKEMKRSPIIGSIATTTGAGAITAFLVAVNWLFPAKICLVILLFSRLVLIVSVIMFIKCSLTSEPMKKFEKDIKNIKKEKNGKA